MQPAVPAGFRADLARWQQLVSPHWLSDLQAGQAVAAAPEGPWQLWEVACDGRAAYLSGHLPGARYVDTRQWEQLPHWNAIPDAQLQVLLTSLGLRAESTVILYGRNTLAAARVAHLLLYAGVSDVRLLDGGLAAWCAAGLGLQLGPLLEDPTPQAPCDSSWVGPFPANPTLLVNTAEARSLAATEGCALVSIRSRAEFTGETSGYDYIAAKGEIPGALWGHAGSDGDVNNMVSYQDEQGCMLPAAEIERIWNAAGIHRGMRIAFYCGTGWRASLAFFYAWLMGWESISVYDGGWMEWSSDPANPVICRAPASA